MKSTQMLIIFMFLSCMCNNYIYAQPVGDISTIDELPMLPLEPQLEYTEDKNELSTPVEAIPEVHVRQDSSMDEEPLRQVEVMPEFPGGQNELMRFLQNNLRYPAEAAEEEIQGKVFIQFVVNENGSVDRVKLIKDPGGGLGAEAIRVIRKMPNWKPGMQNGKNVAVYYTLPVHFTLQ